VVGYYKLASAIVGPDADVLLSTMTTDPDYETELAVVIGRPCHRIAPDDWEQHVFGYTIVNDVSARGVQLATSHCSLLRSTALRLGLAPTTHRSHTHLNSPSSSGAFATDRSCNFFRRLPQERKNLDTILRRFVILNMGDS
jgi:hypothetical protein